MASPSCSSPSSSAVIIPRPGKSILKKPPPPQQSFFSLSRLSRLLPTQNSSSSGTNGDPDENLKRAHFFLPHLATVYPISAANPPCGVTTKEEKKAIEAREAERRRRIVRGNSIGPGPSDVEDWWSTDKVEAFYQECCVGREEQPHPGISAALKVSSLAASLLRETRRHLLVTISTNYRRKLEPSSEDLLLFEAGLPALSQAFELT